MLDFWHLKFLAQVAGRIRYSEKPNSQESEERHHRLI